MAATYIEEISTDDSLTMIAGGMQTKRAMIVM